MFVGKFKLHCFLRFQDSNFYFTYTVRYRYNTVNLLTNILKRHLIAHPLGLAMGCLLQIQHLIDILPQFLKLFMYYLTILDRVITVLGCNMQCVNFRKENVFWVTSMDKDIHFSRLWESTPPPPVSGVQGHSLWLFHIPMCTTISFHRIQGSVEDKRVSWPLASKSCRMSIKFQIIIWEMYFLIMFVRF